MKGGSQTKVEACIRNFERHSSECWNLTSWKAKDSSFRWNDEKGSAQMRTARCARRPPPATPGRQWRIDEEGTGRVQPYA